MPTVTNRSPLGLGALLGRLWNRPRLWRRTTASVGAASDIGTQRRNNEDYYLIADLARTAATIHGNDAFGAVLTAQPVLVVADANDRIRACAAKSAELVGMGTTATVAVLLDSELYVAHVGDSRAYLVRNRRAQQLTTDHSVLQHLIDSGATGAMAAAAEQRHALLRALGPEADVRVDVSCTPVEHGDIVVLCSDGAWSAVADEELAAIVSDAQDLRAACSRLLALANDRGGRDNATVLLARLETVTE
ncbi:MAG: hypothetical protein DME02_00800 [Candidatus Rokuibacteriota bacterium]|nr:MAG: hypothetical protein DME02_00800 [Candidatus Rokubacteria bacterium]